MNFPDDLKYTKDHEWIKLSGKEATIGITDFAQGELGDIVFVDINTVNGFLSYKKGPFALLLLHPCSRLTLIKTLIKHSTATASKTPELRS